MNEPNRLADGKVLGKLDFDGRARATELEENDSETLAWYAAWLESEVLRISAFLVGNGDVAEVAAKQLRRLAL